MGMQGPDGTVGVPLSQDEVTGLSSLVELNKRIEISSLSADNLKKLIEDAERIPDAIINLFTHHAPNDAQTCSYNVIRAAAMRLATIIDANCPESPDRTAAMRKLRESVMSANASIATGGGHYR